MWILCQFCWSVYYSEGEVPLSLSCRQGWYSDHLATSRGPAMLLDGKSGTGQSGKSVAGSLLETQKPGTHPALLNQDPQWFLAHYNFRSLALGNNPLGPLTFCLKNVGLCLPPLQSFYCCELERTYLKCLDTSQGFSGQNQKQLPECPYFL